MSKCIEALKLIEAVCHAEAERWRRELEYVICYKNTQRGMISVLPMSIYWRCMVTDIHHPPLRGVSLAWCVMP